MEDNSKSIYPKSHVANKGEVFTVTDSKHLAKYKKKKIKEIVHGDIPIFCNRCGYFYAEYLDPAFPKYDDFNLCRQCLEELDRIKIGRK